MSEAVQNVPFSARNLSDMKFHSSHHSKSSDKGPVPRDAIVVSKLLRHNQEEQIPRADIEMNTRYVAVFAWKLITSSQEGNA